MNIFFGVGAILVLALLTKSIGSKISLMKAMRENGKDPVDSCAVDLEAGPTKISPLTTRSRQKRSSSAPTPLRCAPEVTGRLQHQIPRVCAYCTTAISAGGDTFMALDKIFCSPDCRGDLVGSSVVPDHSDMHRIAASHLSLEELCRGEF